MIRVQCAKPTSKTHLQNDEDHEFAVLEALQLVYENTDHADSKLDKLMPDILAFEEQRWARPSVVATVCLDVAVSDEELARFGWAPGDYTMRCRDCLRDTFKDDLPFNSKRSFRCRDCAVLLKIDAERFL